MRRHHIRCGDPHCALDGLRLAGGGQAQTICGLAHLAAVGQKLVPGLGQRQGAAQAFKQQHAQLRLQRRHLARQRRLGQAKAEGGG